MHGMTEFRAFISRDRQSVRLVKGAWRMDIKASAAPGWLSFYRKLWARGSKDPKQPGPWAEFYEQPVREMERVCKELTP